MGARAQKGRLRIRLSERIEQPVGADYREASVRSGRNQQALDAASSRALARLVDLSVSSSGR
jgi:hypothetical protein